MSLSSSHWILFAIIALVWIAFLVALGAFMEHEAFATETSFSLVTTHERFGEDVVPSNTP